MKIDIHTLSIMENDINTLIHYYKIDIKKVTINEMNHIWFYTFANRTYLDDNANVKKDEKGVRILPFIDREKYPLYPCNTNDATLFTALKAILTKLQK